MDYLRPVPFVVLPHIGGFAGSFITRKAIKTWYEKLKRPSWRPPNWVFGPMWTTLYTGMGYASYLVWRDGGGFEGQAGGPLTLYGAQLAMNWAWTPIFFGAKRIGLAAIEITGLYGTVIACAFAFNNVNRTAGLLMVPYIGWLTIATSLNMWIWVNNKDVVITDDSEEEEKTK